MSDLQLFIPITKVDAARRLVYGVATAETEDRSGEVCDYATTKPYYEKWSGDIAKATDGKSLGNLRSMHGHVAAGKVTSIAFNDEAKQIEICAKIVDDAEWNKVEEGVYTGFSQGGKYVKRWTDGELTRYTADPSEISLVDLPCLPGATFSMIKADGAEEAREFCKAGVPVIEDDSAKEEKSGVASVSTPVQGDEYEQVWQSKRDGTVFKKKSDLLKYHVSMDSEGEAARVSDPAVKALDELSDMLGIDKEYQAPDSRPADSEGLVKEMNENKSAAVCELEKFSGIEILDSASALHGLDCLCKFFSVELGEDEVSGQAEVLKSVIERIRAFISLESMTVAPEQSDIGISAQTEDMGKRISNCDMGEEHDGLAKVSAENGALRKTIGAMQERMEAIIARLRKIEDEPLPLPLLSGKMRAVSKAEDSIATESGQNDLDSMIAELSKSAEGRDKLMTIAIKVAHANPVPMKLAR